MARGEAASELLTVFVWKINRGDTNKGEDGLAAVVEATPPRQNPVQGIVMMAQTGRSTYDTDVIVIGAGPIGLTAACALGHHGVKTRVFEERSKPKPNSRANNVWARVQELLQGIGVRDALAEVSYKVEKQTALLDGKPLDQVPLNEVKSPFAKVLYSGQDVIEKTLSEQAAAKGAPVERGRRVTALTQDADGVTVTVAAVGEDGKPTGPIETVRGRYLVGADGDTGFTRKAVGLDFETTRMPDRANWSIDAKLKWQRSTDADQLWFFVYHNGFAGVLPVWEGYHRMFFLEDMTHLPDRELTLDEAQARAREITGDATLTFSDPIWFSQNKFQHGVAPGYAKGRVFLAGDAGHWTMPIGGQGMNAGMHDAVCIAWRLAMALSGQAGPTVLASYGEERQRQHAELDERQTTGFKRLAYRGRIADAALDLAGQVIPNLGSKLFGSDDLQQLSVAYRESALSADHLKLKQALKRGVPHAGDRAPNADLIASDGKTTTLFPLLYNAEGHSWGWNLLAFDGRDAKAEPLLRRAAAEVASYAFVRSTLIVSAPEAMADEAAAKDSLSDLDGAAHATYGLNDTPALVLVRPDGHIAFRGPASRPELLQQYCQQTFSPSQAAA